jgi:8-oxo-dGTP diphosphatase
MSSFVAPAPLSYKLAVLVFIEDELGRQLLILRNKEPNKGNWSPIGGKLEMGIGESPFECAARETREETGLEAAPSEFRLFCMIAEKAYEGQSHWLLFLFRCSKRLSVLPPEMSEGRFGFFHRNEIEALSLPETDRKALWPIWDKYRDNFVAMRVDCSDPKDLRVRLEQVSQG